MPAPDRHEFRVEADDLPDMLLRILGPFAVQGATPTSVRHEQDGQGAWTLLETSGLTSERADLLVLRLAQVPRIRTARVRRLHVLAAAAERS